MIVAKLNIDHTTLIGKSFEIGSYFNPIQDTDGNWIVSVEESEHLNENEFELIEYKPIEDEQAI